MVQYIKYWFDNLVDRAIIDGLSYRSDQDEDKRRKNNLFVAGMVLWFVIVAVATYVVVFGGAG